MCMGDMTPVPFRYSPLETGVLKGFIDSNFPRTCRSFDNVRSWVNERNNGGNLTVKQVYRGEEEALERARKSYKMYGDSKIADALES
jgi:hypothetical protein